MNKLPLSDYSRSGVIGDIDDALGQITIHVSTINDLITVLEEHLKVGDVAASGEVLDEIKTELGAIL